jgi:MFS family permease
MAGPIIDTSGQSGPARATSYGWLVFALSFGLLISDYMARQVLNAVFPMLKAEWSLSDAQLGLLSGIVAAMVGLLTLPLSLAADRWGRVRSLTLMAILWSLATLLCAAATSFEGMLLGRALVGVGEAAYGSVGIAVVISVFPQRMRATLSAAFMAGGLFGQVLGVAVGAQIAASYGWRASFAVIGLFGLLLGVIYPMIVKERRLRALAGTAEPDLASAASPLSGAPTVSWASLKQLVGSRSIRLVYLGSGLQLFAAGALPAWLPSYFNRYYALPVHQAGQTAAIFLLICGAGMILCGMLSDHMARRAANRKIHLAMAFSIGTALCLFAAFQLPPGTAQLVLLGLAMFLVAGTTGPAGAMVANLTPLALHGSAFAALTLANNLVGLAPGPILTGRAADTLGLVGAFQLLPVTCLAATFAFALAQRNYLADLNADQPRPE